MRPATVIIAILVAITLTGFVTTVYIEGKISGIAECFR